MSQPSSQHLHERYTCGRDTIHHLKKRLDQLVDMKLKAVIDGLSPREEARKPVVCLFSRMLSNCRALITGILPPRPYDSHNNQFFEPHSLSLRPSIMRQQAQCSPRRDSPGSSMNAQDWLVSLLYSPIWCFLFYSEHAIWCIFQFNTQFLLPCYSRGPSTIAPSSTSTSSSTLSIAYSIRFQVFKLPVLVSSCQTRARRWNRLLPYEQYPPNPLAPP